MLIETVLQGRDLWRRLSYAIEQFQSRRAPKKMYILLYYERNGICCTEHMRQQGIPEGSLILCPVTRNFRVDYIENASFALLLGDEPSDTPLPMQYGIAVHVVLNALRTERTDIAALCNLVFRLQDQQHFRTHTLPMQQHLVEALLLQCRAITMRRTKLKDHDSNTAALVRLRDMIQCNPAQNWTIEEMCEVVGLSRPHLHRVYHEAFGCTCYQDVLQSRLRYADHLLTTTTLSISEITQQCGFENDSNFIRSYKKFRGCTPTTYRKQAKEHSENR